MKEYIEFEAHGNIEYFQRIAEDPTERLTLADDDGKGDWEGRLIIDSINNGVLRGRLLDLVRVGVGEA
jgi:hypothetical protein